MHGSATSRRGLLRAGAGSGALLALGAWHQGLERVSGLEPDAPLFRISLAQWSLHRALFEGRLAPLDFPAEASRVHRIGAVEYVSTFFADRAADFGFLGELRTRAADAGVESLLVMVDGEGALGAADAAARRRALERHFKWLAAASFLGCHAIRVNAQGEGPPEELRSRCADSLRRLAVLAEDYGLDVLVENHGGPSSDGAWLASLMRAADHPRVGTLPDFGNFRVAQGEVYDRYRGVRELMPWARAVSAKSHDFDERGEETSTDFERMLRIVLGAGYRGWVGIEYEGDRLPESQGIARTKELLERVRERLAAEMR